jgi:hypothetical protein
MREPRLEAAYSYLWVMFHYFCIADFYVYNVIIMLTVPRMGAHTHAVRIQLLCDLKISPPK